MSKKTQSRRGQLPRSTASTRAVSSRTVESYAGEVIERMLSGVRTAIAAADPMRAELETAVCLSLPRIVDMEPDQAEAFVSKVLVGEAVRGRSPESAAMLRLLMTLGSAATKRQASQALGELTKAGVYPPDWVTEAGKPVPVQAWRRYDVFGDDEAVLVSFRYGEAEHCIFANVDLTGFPVATTVGVAADVAGLIESIASQDDPFDRAQRIGLAEARDRLESPLALLEREPDPGLSIETVAALPIARSRVRRLPAEGGPQVPASTAADRAAAVDEFMKSPLAAEAVAAGEESTRFWAEVLTGYSGRTRRDRPAQVGPRKLAQMLLGHVPNTFVLSAAQRQHLKPAVTAWTRWSAAYRDLDEAATARLMESLPDTFGRFDAAYEDEIAVTSRGYLTDLATSDADVARLAGHLARRMFALPMPMSADRRTFMDVSDPAGRRALVEDEFGDCDPPGGMTNEQFVAAANRVISELWHHDPPWTFEEAGRLIADGADRHEAIHALAARR